MSVYECVRCGTHVSTEDMDALPLKCSNCGYRVFKKVRGDDPKSTGS